MLIEFAGIPGVGKSTLVATARETLKSLGYFPWVSEKEAGPYCFKRSQLGGILCLVFPKRWHKRLLWGIFRRLLYWYRLKFALNHRRLTWHVLRSLQTKKLSIRNKLIVLEYFLHISSFYQYFNGRLQSHEVLILEEGLVHRSTSIHVTPYEEPVPADIVEYIKLIPRTDLVVFANASWEICVKRVHERGQKRRYLDQELVPYIANTSKAIDMAINRVQENGWNVIKINNDHSLEISRKDLHCALVNTIQGVFCESIDHAS